MSMSKLLGKIINHQCVMISVLFFLNILICYLTSMKFRENKWLCATCVACWEVLNVITPTYGAISTVVAIAILITICSQRYLVHGTKIRRKKYKISQHIDIWTFFLHNSINNVGRYLFMRYRVAKPVFSEMWGQLFIALFSSHRSFL